MNEPMGYGFPHFFVLPMYSSASSYRFRPLGPEETLMEIWSLTRFPEGASPTAPAYPSRWPATIPGRHRSPPGLLEPAPPAAGLHARGFEYMRLVRADRGHISNYHRLIDGTSPVLPHERAAPALRRVNVNPLERAGRRPRWLIQRRSPHEPTGVRRTGRDRHRGRRHHRAATAELLVAEGASVVVADVDVEQGEASPWGWATGGRSSEPTWANRMRCKRSSTLAVERFGGLHVMLNNAGIGSGLKVSCPTISTTSSAS